VIHRKPLASVLAATIALVGEGLYLALDWSWWLAVIAVPPLALLAGARGQRFDNGGPAPPPDGPWGPP